MFLPIAIVFSSVARAVLPNAIALWICAKLSVPIAIVFEFRLLSISSLVGFALPDIALFPIAIALFA